MDINSKIYVAGHMGLLGSAIVRALKAKGYGNIITKDRDFDLTDPERILCLFDLYKPEYVFMAAAKVGSIAENIKYPVEFLNENILIQKNVFAAAHIFKVKKLLFFSSNCCYPRDCIQPISEDYFMTGLLEPTNEAYAIAKIAGMKLCQSYNTQYGTKFYSLVLASLYGPNDHFGSNKAHVIADMIHKFHNAKEECVKELTFWGDGSPLREFMYVDDAANAVIFLMDNFNPSFENNMAGRMFLNVGTGEEISIADLTRLISDIVGYKDKINWDTSKPNGMPRKLLDSSKCHVLSWHHKTMLIEGLQRTYQWYLKNFLVKN